MVWLLRHGDAEAGSGEDAARELTERGVREAANAGRALRELGVSLDACLASPKARARETARIVCEALALEVEVTRALAGGEIDVAGLVAGRGNVLLVGHEPDLSNAVAALTGATVEMKKGGLAAVENGAMSSLLRPEQLARIANR